MNFPSVLSSLLFLFVRSQMLYSLYTKSGGNNIGKEKKILFPISPFPFPYSGYYDIGPKNDTHIFYVLSYSQDLNTSRPLILWLQGGPGGASTGGGMLGENGPYIINEDLSLSPNPYAWNKHTHMLWIDQPAGAGWSYVGTPESYCNSSECASEQLYEVLIKFFDSHPEFKKVDFWITGESYAGKYIPSTSFVIQEKGGIPNFKGFVVIDGMMDPENQMDGYAEPGFVNSLFSSLQMKYIYNFQNTLLEMIEKKDWVNCGKTYVDMWMPNGFFKTATGGINYYDIRNHGGYDFAFLIEKWMNQSWVKEKMFKIPSFVEYHLGSSIVLQNFLGDFCHSIIPKLVFLLDNNIGKDFYFLIGQFDYIINRVQIEKVLMNLPWKYNKEFNDQDRTFWKNKKGELAGYFREFMNLHYVTVLDSGHMSPMDKPANIQEL